MQSPFQFQPVSWHVDDSGHDNTVIVNIFGRRRDAKSVALRVSGFKPSFALAVDESVATEQNYSTLLDLLRRKLWYNDQHIDTRSGITHAKNLWGYSRKTTPFFTYAFKSCAAYKSAYWLFLPVHKSKTSVERARAIYTKYTRFMSAQEDPDLPQREARTEHLRLKKLFIAKETADKVEGQTIDFIITLGEFSLPFEFAQIRLFNVIDQCLQFLHEKKIRPAGWLSVAAAYPVDDRQKVTTCDVELNVDKGAIEPLECEDICTEIREMTFDIEAYGTGSFPDGKNPDDPVFQIGVAFKKYGDPHVRRYLLHFHKTGTSKCGEIPDTEVSNFGSETELILGFRRLIHAIDPDFTYGYNSDVFDWSYLMYRAEVLGCMDEFATLSRLRDFKCKVQSSSFSSAGRGTRDYYRVEIPGRVSLDLLVWLRANVKVSKYDMWTLDTVAKKEIGESKLDMPIPEMKRAWERDDADMLTKVGAYCVQDCLLPQKIIIKLDVLTQVFAMANVTMTPIMLLLTRGEGIKTFSLICAKCREVGFMVPVMDPRNTKETFKGATVVDPTRGVHTDPVITLDFKSLYPSIFIAYLICYSTLVRDPDLREELLARADKTTGTVHYDGVDFQVVAWQEMHHVQYSTAHGRRTFNRLERAKEVTGDSKADIQDTSRTRQPYWRLEEVSFQHVFAQVQECVLPHFLTSILAERSAVKKMMGAIASSTDVDDQLRYRVLNGRQQALKVTANSVYGFPGAFLLNELALGSSVTAVGRKMNKQTVDFCNEKFEAIARARTWSRLDCCTYLNNKFKEVVDYELTETPPGWQRKFPTAREDRPWVEGSQFSVEVIGGDSVSGDTPILCHDPATKTVSYYPIDSLGSGAVWETRSDGKEYRMDVPRLEVHTDRGFTRILRVIRHSAQGKKIFRVCTSTGMVDVTEDHSLLKPDGEKVSPHDVNVGDALLHTDLPMFIATHDDGSKDDEKLVDFFWALGLFLGDGSINDNEICIDNHSQEHLVRARASLCKWTENVTSSAIVSSPTMHRGFRLVISSEQGSRLFRRWFFCRDAKKVPDFVMNGCLARNFGDGYCASDASWSTQIVADRLELCVMGKLATAGLYHVFAMLGFQVTLKISINNTRRFVLTLETTSCDGRGDIVRSISEIPGSGYVYDIETENHHFNVGPGRMHVHNTDSVFVKFNGASIAHAISLGYKAADLLSALFNRPPIEMEFEKVTCPEIILVKKNYAGLMYTTNDTQFSVVSTGLPLAKRTSCPFLKKVYLAVMLPFISCEKNAENKVVKIQGDNQNIEARVSSVLRDHLQKLVDGVVPIEELYLTKSLARSYQGSRCCTKCPADEVQEDCTECNGRGHIVALAQVALADRMKRRDPGSEPAVGERFSYIFVRDEYRDDSLSANSETPEFAKEHGLPPDLLFYLNNQLRLPLVQLCDIGGLRETANRIFDDIEDALRQQVIDNRKRLAALEKPEDVTGFWGQRTRAMFQRPAPVPSALYMASKRDALKKTHVPITTFFHSSLAGTQASAVPVAAKRKRTTGKIADHKITSFFKP